MRKIIFVILIVFGFTATGCSGRLKDNAIEKFKDNGDGTVTDAATGLTWQQEDDNVQRDWEAAITYCEGLNHANRQNWRLPNIKELRTIIDMTTSNPTIDSIAFPGTNTLYYWSATPGDYSGHAWYVNFKNGYVYYYNKSAIGYVRCVRLGQ